MTEKERQATLKSGGLPELDRGLKKERGKKEKDRNTERKEETDKQK